jgi:hypothetical protein
VSNSCQGASFPFLSAYLIAAFLFVLLSADCLWPDSTLAEFQVLTVEVMTTVKEVENRSIAGARLVREAKQIAIELIGADLEFYPKIRPYHLTSEQVQTLVGGLMKVQILQHVTTPTSDGLQIMVKIKATLTTQRTEMLAQRILAKNAVAEYVQLQERYGRLNRELERWQDIMTKTSQSEVRSGAVDQIRECEKNFVLTHLSEVNFYAGLVSPQ